MSSRPKPNIKKKKKKCCINLVSLLYTLIINKNNDHSLIIFLFSFGLLLLKCYYCSSYKLGCVGDIPRKTVGDAYGAFFYVDCWS